MVVVVTVVVVVVVVVGSGVQLTRRASIFTNLRFAMSEPLAA